MRGRTVIETRGDRMELAQDAGLGKVSFVSALAGVLVAYGAFIVVGAAVAGIAEATGFDREELSANDWTELGTAGGIAVGGVLLICYLFGGYVAGRMARRAGVLNGLAVFVLGIAIAGGVGAAVGAIAGADRIVDNLRDAGIPTTSDEWNGIGTMAGIGSLAGMLLGSLLGGRLGESWHGKLLSRAWEGETEAGMAPEVAGPADVTMAASDKEREARRFEVSERA